MELQNQGILFVLCDFDSEYLRAKSRCSIGKLHSEIARTVRERKLNRCNSDTDSKVWMEEEFCGMPYLCALSIYSGLFLWRSL